MNKEEVSALIERLADKTLSFGTPLVCRGDAWYEHAVVIDETHALNVTTKRYFDFLNVKGLELMGWEVVNLILIGDVLEKIKKPEPNEGISTREARLLRHWKKLDMSKSFQTIIEESGWEERLDFDILGKPIKLNPILKNPKARALAEFLLAIFK